VASGQATAIGSSTGLTKDSHLTSSYVESTLTLALGALCQRAHWSLVAQSARVLMCHTVRCIAVLQAILILCSRHRDRLGTRALLVYRLTGFVGLLT
jgi:TctA family transporter